MIVARASTVAAAALLAAAPFVLPVSASAEDEPLAGAAAVLSVNDLGDIYGRYTPQTLLPITESIGTRAVTDVTRSVASINVTDATPGALATIGSSLGTVQNLDLTLASTWKTATGTTYSAGLDLTLTPATSSMSQQTWATVSGGSDILAALPGSAQVLASGFSGVGQTIALAGSGNQAANRAAVTVAATALPPLPFTVPSGAPCVNACHVGIDAQGAHLAIALGAGTATQNVGVNGILQTIHAQSDLNTIQNLLGLHVQFTPATFNPSAILPVLVQGNLVR